MNQHAVLEERKRAVDAGAKAYRDGKQLGDCPSQFLPKMGDSRLYDSWVMGFRAAAMAHGRGSD